MKPPAAHAYFRQLSCLGIDSRQAVGAMVDEIPRIVPGARSLVAWTDAHGSPFDICLPDVLPSVLDLFINSHNLFVGAGEPSIESCARTPGPYLRLWDSFGVDFLERSNCYQGIFRPLHMHHMVAVPIHRSGHPIGLLGSYREQSDPPFSHQEVAQLVALTPYLRHAMLSVDEGWETVESDDRGVVICDASGRIVSQSQSARRLLTYAVNERVGLGNGHFEFACSVLPEIIRPVCASLVDIARGKTAPPPRKLIRNPWGVFEVTAESLTSGAEPGAEPDAVCLIIRRRQPLPLRLVSMLRTQPLSERQKQLALHLALDRPVDEILARMGIGAHTYRDHVRAVYAGLDVSNRAQLLGRLLNSDREPPLVRDAGRRRS
jgi:DNA-binding CsgD family transcriptional regulator